MSRIRPGAMPWHQLLGNRLAAGLIRLLYWVPLTDLGPFQAARRDEQAERGVRVLAVEQPLQHLSGPVPDDERDLSAGSEHRARCPEDPLGRGDVLEHVVTEAWAARLAEALSGGVTTPTYVGFVGEEGEDGVHRAYPPTTLQRLVQVKRRYDPDNLFHLNLNVAPDMGRG